MKNLFTQRRQNGFTLVELLIVIGLVALLISLILANILGYLQKARDNRRKQDLAKLAVTMEDYFNDNSKYPPTNNYGQIESLAWGSSWQPYLSVLPRDPSVSQTYYYDTDAALQNWFIIYAKLESKNDPDIARSGCVPACGPGGKGWYNYAVHSPNIAIVPVAPIGGGPLQPTITPMPTSIPTAAPAPSPTTNPNVTIQPSSTPNLLPTSTPGPPTPTPSTGPGLCFFGQCGFCQLCGGVLDCPYRSQCWYDGLSWGCRSNPSCI